MTSINSNIATTMANSINSLKLSTATKAFQNASKPVEKPQDIFEEDKKLIDNKLFQKLPTEIIDEMKEISLRAGEILSDDDIQYALQYGRSVIADYSV